MGLSTAEKNRRKRERKKRAKEAERKRLEQEQEEEKQAAAAQTSGPERVSSGDSKVEVEIEYEAEPLLVNQDVSGGGGGGVDIDGGLSSNGDGNDEDSISAVLRRFHARASLVSDDEEKKEDAIESSTDANDAYADSDDDDDDDEDGQKVVLSNRKLRELNRPTIAELKNRVERSDLVEAHDITSKDPDFLLFLKAVPSTVPVPRHWGRKRKYLQGKRGIEKAPFQLPDFIVKTGITEVRAKVDEDESGFNAKRKNRSRVAPKMGQLDVDYRTLHDAFFKHQNRASIQEKLTTFGDLYYEGKEFETQKSSDLKVGGRLSERLREALGMMSDNAPTPWLINMQRYGPPPSYPNLKIPGLNAPLPAGCSYGYHLNGWGKPPVDNFGRPLFGGNPFDPPGSSGATSTADWDFDSNSATIVTSDGKPIKRKPWGALPMAGIDVEDEESSSEEEESSDDESSSGDEMMESEEEGEETEDKETAAGGQAAGGTESVVPVSAYDLRKQAGGETPAPTESSKQLYTVLHQTSADKEKQAGAVFASDVSYVVPGSNIPEGMESVLSKAPLNEAGKRKRNDADDDDDDKEDLGKKFKF